MRRIPIIQGEHAVVSEPHVIISTLLGSCVAVCLYDPVAKVGGMNHFLLGEPGVGQAVSPVDMQRYGVHAMELLINGMMGKGASRQQLRAHIYGGANIISGLGSIGSSNAAFARRFMDTEGIGIGHCDVGGTSARKVEFLPHDGRSRCTKVAQAVPEVAPRPAPKPATHGGELELF
ncbi:chemotaxis protein CheD [Stakelama tenebrarum]|uniref:Probable chemoreceptor glutamine deamidase CheD n=1 Tax=Stakelama tenebrarum TaxID=2711215 RepID=A0A6G6Y4I3_9SPHN|nr:chemotaxis protein CheD [Sphingosinithalassobacter tenebrarum]QIG79717.1 chemotaxis protein CheD [Sphingosinithalassobacter tenebrarum]